MFTPISFKAKKFIKLSILIGFLLVICFSINQKLTIDSRIQARESEIKANQEYLVKQGLVPPYEEMVNFDQERKQAVNIKNTSLPSLILLNSWSIVLYGFFIVIILLATRVYRILRMKYPAFKRYVSSTFTTEKIKNEKYTLILNLLIFLALVVIIIILI